MRNRSRRTSYRVSYPLAVSSLGMRVRILELKEVLKDGDRSKGKLVEGYYKESAGAIVSHSPLPMPFSS